MAAAAGGGKGVHAHEMHQQKQACAMCGSPIAAGSKPIFLKIEGRRFALDSEDCAMTLRKFRCVYGNDFCLMLAK